MLETLFFYVAAVMLLANVIVLFENVIVLFEMWHILDTGQRREFMQDEED